jgi:hypothetical protein
MSKTLLRHTLIKKIFLTFLLTPYLYTFSLYENASFIIFSAETEYISSKSWYRNINFLRDRNPVEGEQQIRQLKNLIRAIKRFALFDLLKSLYSDTKILTKYNSIDNNT